MFFMSSLAKILAIAVLVLVASRFSGAGALFFIQGWSMSYLGVIAAGLKPSARGGRHGT
jgi:hypothetical protein